MGGYRDPEKPIVRAPRRADGQPPPEVVQEFLADAKKQGCTCDPEVTIVAVVGGGSINLRHKWHCPLIRVLGEQAR